MVTEHEQSAQCQNWRLLITRYNLLSPLFHYLNIFTHSSPSFQSSYDIHTSFEPFIPLPQYAYPTPPVISKFIPNSYFFWALYSITSIYLPNPPVISKFIPNLYSITSIYFTHSPCYSKVHTIFMLSSTVICLHFSIKSITL